MFNNHSEFSSSFLIETIFKLVQNQIALKELKFIGLDQLLVLFDSFYAHKTANIDTFLTNYFTIRYAKDKKRHQEHTT